MFRGPCCLRLQCTDFIFTAMETSNLAAQSRSQFGQPSPTLHPGDSGKPLREAPN